MSRNCGYRAPPFEECYLLSIIRAFRRIFREAEVSSGICLTCLNVGDRQDEIGVLRENCRLHSLRVWQNHYHSGIRVILSWFDILLLLRTDISCATSAKSSMNISLVNRNIVLSHEEICILVSSRTDEPFHAVFPLGHDKCQVKWQSGNIASGLGRFCIRLYSEAV
jgi:hypothetical protein